MSKTIRLVVIAALGVLVFAAQPVLGGQSDYVWLDGSSGPTMIDCSECTCSQQAAPARAPSQTSQAKPLLQIAPNY